MDFTTFLKTRISSSANPFAVGGLTGSSSNQLQNISLFTAASLEELKNLDLESLLAEEKASGSTDATRDEKALSQIIKALMELDDVKAYADVNGDGKVEQAEAMDFLQNIMGNDGDVSKLTMQDIDTALQKMKVDLDKIALNTVDDMLNEYPVDSETTTSSGTTPSAPSSGSTPSAGSSSGTDGKILNLKRWKNLIKLSEINKLK